MVAINSVPNDEQLERAFIGTENPKYTAATPTYKLYGHLEINKDQALSSRPDYAGTRLADYTPVDGVVSIDGTYTQGLSFEDLAILPRYGVMAAPAGVTDSQTVPGYTYAYRTPLVDPSFNFFTAETGFPGIPYRAESVFWNQFTISGDTDDAENDWKFNAQVLARTKDLLTSVVETAATGGTTTTIVKTGAAWTVNAYTGAYAFIRSGVNDGSALKIASNTVDTLTLVGTLGGAVVSGVLFEISGLFTPAIPDRTRESIKMAGSKLYLDTASAIGTTQVLGKFISFSITYDNGMYLKRFAENEFDYARKTNAGLVRVTGQVALEFDDPREEEMWVARQSRKLRIERTGSVINTSPETRKRARLDAYRIRWGSPTAGTRQQNKIKTWPFTAYVDTTETVPFEIATLVPMATLP